MGCLEVQTLFSPCLLLWVFLWLSFLFPLVSFYSPFAFVHYPGSKTVYGFRTVHGFRAVASRGVWLPVPWVFLWLSLWFSSGFPSGFPLAFPLAFPFVPLWFPMLGGGFYRRTLRCHSGSSPIQREIPPVFSPARSLPGAST